MSHQALLQPVPRLEYVAKGLLASMASVTMVAGGKENAVPQDGVGSVGPCPKATNGSANGVSSPVKLGKVSGIYVDPNAPEFVEGWSMVQTLGEGAFGEVKLLINRESGEGVAMKMVDLSKHPEAEDCVKKEMLIHKMLKHDNVLKFFGFRREGAMQYMFLEYAIGGELFDRIEPDEGMSHDKAKKYFRELIEGVSYLHTRGVTHRDIKPENLLLDGNDTLKISDFGMATLFRHKGKERALNRRCGTKPYMSPEVLNEEEYTAQPADLWSCGIVLVTLYAGELPWDAPSTKYKEFSSWLNRDSSCMSLAPWTKINTVCFGFLRRLLNPDPAARLTMDQIRSHYWFKTNEPDCARRNVIQTNFVPAAITSNDVQYTDREDTIPPPNKKLRSELAEEENKTECSSVSSVAPSEEDYLQRLACSQPTNYRSVEHVMAAAAELDTDTLCFSQPAKPDHLLLTSSQADDEDGSRLQRLVRRMTRVLVKTNIKDTIVQLDETFTKLHLHFTSSVHSPNILTLTTVDRRGAPLVMKASVYKMAPHVLVDFRLSKGCGLDFKRQFVRIKESLGSIVVPGPPDMDQ